MGDWKEYWQRTMSDPANDIHGRQQVSVLRRYGLRPEHTLLEAPCGRLRAGRHLINYLKWGQYWGIDTDIRRALNTVTLYDLTLRYPRLLQAMLPEEPPGLPDDFDFIWMIGITDRCSLERIRATVDMLLNHLGKDGRFLADFVFKPDRKLVSEEDPRSIWDYKRAIWTEADVVTALEGVATVSHLEYQLLKPHVYELRRP